MHLQRRLCIGSNTEIVEEGLCLLLVLFENRHVPPIQQGHVTLRNLLKNPNQRLVAVSTSPAVNPREIVARPQGQNRNRWPFLQADPFERADDPTDGPVAATDKNAQTCQH